VNFLYLIQNTKILGSGKPKISNSLLKVTIETMKKRKKTKTSIIRANKGKTSILSTIQQLHNNQHGNQNGGENRANPESLIFSNSQGHFLPIRLKIIEETNKTK
jgi:hypothetical protein